MPILKNLSFEGQENIGYAVKMIDDDERNFFIEDSNGSMNPDGVQGYFVNNSPRMTAFIDESLCSTILDSPGLVCKNTCLRRMIVTTDAGPDHQMTVTSKVDPAKSFVFDKFLTLTSDAFDVVLPLGEYDMHFRSTPEGEIMGPPVTLEFADEVNVVDPPSCEYITAESITFETAPPTTSPAPTVLSLFYYLVCGKPDAACGGMEEPANEHSLHEVRCCADSQLGPGWKLQSSCQNTLGRSVWGDSEVNGVCYHAENHHKLECERSL